MDSLNGKSKTPSDLEYIVSVLERCAVTDSDVKAETGRWFWDQLPQLLERLNGNGNISVGNRGLCLKHLIYTCSLYREYAVDNGEQQEGQQQDLEDEIFLWKDSFDDVVGGISKNDGDNIRNMLDKFINNEKNEKPIASLTLLDDKKQGIVSPPDMPIIPNRFFNGEKYKQIGDRHMKSAYAAESAEKKVEYFRKAVWAYSETVLEKYQQDSLGIAYVSIANLDRTISGKDKNSYCAKAVEAFSLGTGKEKNNLAKACRDLAGVADTLAEKIFYHQKIVAASQDVIMEGRLASSNKNVLQDDLKNVISDLYNFARAQVTLSELEPSKGVEHREKAVNALDLLIHLSSDHYFLTNGANLYVKAAKGDDTGKEKYHRSAIEALLKAEKQKTLSEREYDNLGSLYISEAVHETNNEEKQKRYEKAAEALKKGTLGQVQRESLGRIYIFFSGCTTDNKKKEEHFENAVKAFDKAEEGGWSKELYCKLGDAYLGWAGCTNDNERKKECAKNAVKAFVEAEKAEEAEKPHGLSNKNQYDALGMAYLSCGAYETNNEGKRKQYEKAAEALIKGTWGQVQRERLGSIYIFFSGCTTDNKKKEEHFENAVKALGEAEGGGRSKELYCKLGDAYLGWAGCTNDNERKKECAKNAVKAFVEAEKAEEAEKPHGLSNKNQYDALGMAYLSCGAYETNNEGKRKQYEKAAEALKKGTLGKMQLERLADISIFFSGCTDNNEEKKEHLENAVTAFDEAEKQGTLVKAAYDQFAWACIFLAELADGKKQEEYYEKAVGAFVASEEQGNLRQDQYARLGRAYNFLAGCTDDEAKKQECREKADVALRKGGVEQPGLGDNSQGQHDNSYSNDAGCCLPLKLFFGLRARSGRV